MSENVGIWTVLTYIRLFFNGSMLIIYKHIPKNNIEMRMHDFMAAFGEL